MKKIILIIFTCLSFVALAQNGAKNFIDQPYIEVTGTAEMEVIPNQIYLNIKIDEKQQKKDLAEVEKLMLGKLEEIGIDVAKKLSVKDMMSNLKSYWLRTAEAYDTKKYQLIVEDVKMAGKVFEALDAIGISNISVEKVNHTDIQQFREEVKINAIKAAKTKATALANAIDQTIGKAIYIQEAKNASLGRLSNSVVNVSNFFAKTKEAKDEPEIEFEKIKLQYAIEVRFEI